MLASLAAFSRQIVAQTINNAKMLYAIITYKNATDTYCPCPGTATATNQIAH